MQIRQWLELAESFDADADKDRQHRFAGIQPTQRPNRLLRARAANDDRWIVGAVRSKERCEGGRLHVLQQMLLNEGRLRLIVRPDEPTDAPDDAALPHVMFDGAMLLRIQFIQVCRGCRHGWLSTATSPKLRIASSAG